MIVIIWPVISSTSFPPPAKRLFLAFLTKMGFVKDIFAEKIKNHFWYHLHRDNNKIVIQSITKKNSYTLVAVLLFQNQMEIPNRLIQNFFVRNQESCNYESLH